MKLAIFLTIFLISSTSAILIHCDFNFNSNWVSIGRVYTCDATILEISSNSSKISGINGTHVAGNSSDDVRMIDFTTNSNCSQLSAIPSGFLNFFPNVIAFYFVECGIKTLIGSELNEYPNLEWFGLYRSELERIPGNFFASTPQIKFINFNSNQIARVGENLLGNLTNLERVYFNNNICISKYGTDVTGIAELIETLRTNCSDFEITTTTPGNNTTTTLPGNFTTTNGFETTTPSTCVPGNTEFRICELEILTEKLENQVNFLSLENEELRGKVENLEVRLARIEQYLDGCPWC